MADAEAIIIKRVKKGGHDGHHGGAWKVAYADFVTAMMAFFLLLWLLNATTEAQKQGIADYFSPTALSMSSGGAGGMLGGQTISSPGAMLDRTAVPSISIELKPASGRSDGGSQRLDRLRQSIGLAERLVRDNAAEQGVRAGADAGQTDRKHAP